MVADISQASTLPVGPTRFAARIVWLPAPQARSRTRMPGRTPAISMTVSVADDSPAENSRSHFAQPGAAFSQVLRSSDFEALSAISESCFSGCIAMSPKRLSTLQWSVEKNLDSARCLKSISGADPPRTAVPSFAWTAAATCWRCEKHFVRFGSKADIATQLPIGLVSVNLDNCLPRRASRALIVSGQYRAELSVIFGASRRSPNARVHLLQWNSSLTMELYVEELTYTFWRYLNARPEKR